MAERTSGPESTATCFRDAYLRRHPGHADALERQLLLRSMGFPARLLFQLLGRFRPHSFNPDRSLVESMTSIRNRDDLESRLEEFHDLNRIDRSFRRRVLGVRVSPVRLRRIVEPLLAELAPTEPVDGTTAPAAPVTSGNSRLRPADLRSEIRGPRSAAEADPRRAGSARRARELEAEIEGLKRRVAELTAELERLER